MKERIVSTCAYPTSLANASYAGLSHEARQKKTRGEAGPWEQVVLHRSDDDECFVILVLVE